MQLVAVKLKALNELLDRPFRLEGKKRHAKRDVPPLTGVFGKVEALAELLDDILSLFLLCVGEYSETG